MNRAADAISESKNRDKKTSSVWPKVLLGVGAAAIVIFGIYWIRKRNADKQKEKMG